MFAERRNVAREELRHAYATRFDGQQEKRDAVWRVLCHWLQAWVEPEAAVLDLGAGRCEFINHIQAAEKFAFDLNPDTLEQAGTGVRVIAQDVTGAWPLASSSVDVVFTSNFFEHLPTREALEHCLRETHRVLRDGGTLLALGPNIRFCYDVYWDFFDHYLPLSDRSLTEVLTLQGFTPERVIPKFLPFTMSNGMPAPPALVKLYLRLPVFWRVLGKQFFVVARKTRRVAMFPSAA